MFAARSPSPSAFGVLLRRYRLGAGLSQQMLADLARMSVDGIGALERGERRTPQRETIALLADALRLGTEQRAAFEAAAARTPAPRLGRAAVTAGPWIDPLTSNLPSALSSFVGRAAELVEVGALVREHRLVTLTGAGGVGKTQMAIRIGEALIESADEHVCLVELASIAAPSLVAAAIAAALSVRESPDRDLAESLVTALKHRRLTLILDNCEHVIAGAATIAEHLLRSCPELQILATSREPLKATGEHAFRLPSLAFPAFDDVRRNDATAATKYGSVVLFCQRARAADHRFVLSDENAPAVSEICRRLDGIPLAIELAAARVPMLSVAALSQQLDDRLRLLTAGSRTAPPRQQTMRATIDWSYDLLPPHEQRFFEDLSVFAGGFTLSAAATVFGDEDGRDVSSLDLLSSLVSKSLVVADFEWNEPRYRLLESFRQYASEKLQQRGAANVVAARHARTYADLAERAWQSWDTASDAWADRFEPELDNWRAALEWSLTSGNAVELGQRIAAGLSNVWMLFARAEGRRWIGAAIDRIDERTPHAVVATLNYAKAYIGAAATEELAGSERALELYRALGDDEGAVRAQSLAGRALFTLGRVAGAEHVLVDGLANARRLGMRRCLAELLRFVADVNVARGDFSQARGNLAEAQTIYASVGAEESGAVNVSWSLAELEFLAGNTELAIDHANDAARLLRGMNDTQNLSKLLINMSAYHNALDRFDEANACAVEALNAAREQQLPTDMVRALARIAIIAIMRQRERGEPGFPALRQAARLLGFAGSRLGAPASADPVPEDADRVRALAILGEALGADELATLLALGATMTDEQAIAASEPRGHD